MARGAKVSAREDWEGDALFLSLPSFFLALSPAIFFARAPLSERLEQSSLED